MTCLQITLPVPGSGPALLTLPQPLTADALRDVEHAVAAMLGMLRRDLPDVCSGAAADTDRRRADAAETEYASWTAHLPVSRR